MKPRSEKSEKEILIKIQVNKAINMSSDNKNNNENQHQHLQTRFPITKPGLCATNPKFPYRDIRHYTDPCCDFPKECQYGYIAQNALNQSFTSRKNCHSPELPTSHPWFEPSSP